MQQEKVSLSSVFVTLTYAPEHLPLSMRGLPTVSKRDCQLFFKCLRKAHPPGTEIKYYIAAEYGGETLRPHYHAIIFGADKSLIQNAWKRGSVFYGDVSGASIGYTLKYINKKGRIPVGPQDDRVREFAHMSKGLGLSFLSGAVRRWYAADPSGRMYCPLPGGKKIALPRYYRIKLYPDDATRKAIAVAARNQLLELRQLPRVGEGTWYVDVQAAFRKWQKKADHDDRL